MTLHCKPKGRGNWRTLVLSLEGVHVLPILLRAGQTFALGGIPWRICEVKP